MNCEVLGVNGTLNINPSETKNHISSENQVTILLLSAENVVLWKNAQFHQ